MAVDPFFLVSMPGEKKHPAQGNRKTCRELTELLSRREFHLVLVVRLLSRRAHGNFTTRIIDDVRENYLFLTLHCHNRFVSLHEARSTSQGYEMSNWNLVWLQHSSTPATSRPSNSGDPGAPLSPTLRRSIDRLQRPTTSSQAKVEPALYKRMHVLHYTEQDSYCWDKMPVFGDVKKCIWTPDGSIKRSTKL
ncbi:hypothetical protein LSAT2_014641 [Lamellibrachia satsuma]|nr:hypothetical protein LSAT2_014641 [Lamellibrachia satsuma]